MCVCVCVGGGDGGVGEEGKRQSKISLQMGSFAWISTGLSR